MIFPATIQSNRKKSCCLNSPVIHIILIVLVGATAYSDTLNVPYFLDDINVFGYDKVKISEIIFNGGQRRITDMTFAINNKIHGLHVTGYHLVNITIHLLSSVVLYYVMSSLLYSLKITYDLKEDTTFVERFMPLAVALLFVSHPVQTQAVTYIIQRHTSLATLFYLLCVLSGLKLRLEVEKSGLNVRAWLFAGTSLAAGLLANGSKQIAVTLPLVLFFTEILFFKGKLINKRFYLACGTLLLIVLFAGFVNWYDSSWHEFIYDLNYATSEDHNASRTTYFFTQTRVVASYLSLLCLPIGQSLIHDVPVYRTLFSAPVLVSLSLHIFFISTAFVLFRQSQQILSSHDSLHGILKRLASFGIAWFYITMAVESSIFPIRDVMFEHRIYLPSIGFFMTITAFIALLTLNRQVVAWSVISVMVVLLEVMTIARNELWNNDRLFWEDNVKKAPHSGFAKANLGGAYMVRNMPDKALPLFLGAMRKNVNFQAFYLGEALIMLNIDRSRFTTGKEFIFPEGGFVNNKIDKQSLFNYEVATRNTSALANEYLGDLNKAKMLYIQTLNMNPAYDKAWYNLGLLSLRLGDAQQATDALTQLHNLNSSLAGSLQSCLIESLRKLENGRP